MGSGGLVSVADVTCNFEFESFRRSCPLQSFRSAANSVTGLACNVILGHRAGCQGLGQSPSACQSNLASATDSMVRDPEGMGPAPVMLGFWFVSSVLDVGCRTSDIWRATYVDIVLDACVPA